MGLQHGGRVAGRGPGVALPCVADQCGGGRGQEHGQRSTDAPPDQCGRATAVAWPGGGVALVQVSEPARTYGCPLGSCARTCLWGNKIKKPLNAPCCLECLRRNLRNPMHCMPYTTAYLRAGTTTPGGRSLCKYSKAWHTSWPRGACVRVMGLCLRCTAQQFIYCIRSAPPTSPTPHAHATPTPIF